MINLAEEERKEAHRFLASIGLYLHCNHIWRVAGPPIPFTPHETAAVQLLWDAEWENLKPAIIARIEAEETVWAMGAAQERANLKLAAELKEQARREAAERKEQARREARIGLRRMGFNPPKPQIEPQTQPQPSTKPGRYYLHAPPDYDLQREHRNRLRGVNPEAASGFTEHHLYGPRGFKNPFKYDEERPARFTMEMPSLLPKIKYGKAQPLSYRPHSPLAEDHELSIVTSGICGDPPKGRSALEARTHG